MAALARKLRACSRCFIEHFALGGGGDHGESEGGISNGEASFTFPAMAGRRSRGASESRDKRRLGRSLALPELGFCRSLDALTLPLERLVGWQAKFPPNRHILLLPGGPEAVHGELEFAALVGATLRMVPSAELQIFNGSSVMRWQAHGNVECRVPNRGKCEVRIVNVEWQGNSRRWPAPRFA